MVTNYSRGYSLENKLKRYLESKGYLVLRSSGSHTPIDLIALPSLPPYRWGVLINLYFIQCKKTTKDVDYLYGFQPLLDIEKKYGGTPVLVYSLRRTGMFARVITGERETIKRTDNNVKVEDFF